MSNRLTAGPLPLRVTYFKAWREYRGLTLEQLADRMREHLATIALSTISRVENRQLPYGQAFLEAYALAVECEPYDLLNLDPSRSTATQELNRIMGGLRPEDAYVVRTVAESLHDKRIATRGRVTDD